MKSKKDEKLDWEDFSESLVRSASMQLWKERVDIKLLKAPIVHAVRQLNLWPASIGVRHTQAARMQVRKWRTESDVNLDEFGDISLLTVESALRKKQRNKSAILRVFSIGKDSLYIEASPDILSVELAIDILSSFLPFLTPIFGFSQVYRRFGSMQYHYGVQGSGMDEERTARAQVLEQVRFTMPGDEPVLGQRLFDIHELNFLTQRHLELPVFGTTLEKWIAAGSRGTLRALKAGVFAWIVPDSIRSAVRLQFLNAGYLIVSV